jgi:hypothetical protein
MEGGVRMHEVWGDTVCAFEVARIRSIMVAVVATVAIIGPAQAQDLAARRVAPEIGSAGYSMPKNGAMRATCDDPLHNSQ